MTGLDQFRTSTACQAEMVRRKTAAADAIEYCAEQLEKLGYRPINEISDTGFLILRIDPDAVDIEAPVTPSPFPDPPDTSIGEDPKAAPAQSEAHVGQGAKKADKPKPQKAEDLPAPKPGRWTDRDETRLIEMTLDGHGPKVIAAALARPVQQIHAKKNYMKKQIEAARQGRAAEVQTPTKPQEPAGTRPRRPAPKPAAVPAPKKQAADPGAATPKKRGPAYWLARIRNIAGDAVWTPQRDAALIAHLMRGAGTGGAAALLKLQREDVSKRIKELTGSTTPDPETLTGVQKAIAETYPQSQPENENV